MSESICAGCAHRDYCNLSDLNFQGKKEVVLPIRSCYCFKEAKRTNADRIRSMTDEELANFLMDVSIHGGIHIDGSTTRWSIYEWLKKEVDE